MKELEESIAKSGWNENVDMQEKVNGCRTIEETVKAIQEFEQIIQKKRATSCGQPFTKAKYFKNSQRENDLLAIWF